MTQIQSKLLRWYKQHARDLPWRRTKDPYRILVSEIMLQQTQVDRVLPYYQRFLEVYPDEQALSVSRMPTLHRLWKGLGYPSRAERLRETCRIVCNERGGVWPDTVEGLQELPGIGPYTSAAVACFAFERAVAVVDTNVARVYARRDGLAMPIDKKALWQHAAIQVHGRQPVAYNNALMEIGALICTARNPSCGKCPWRNDCQSINDEPAIIERAAPLKVAAKKKTYGVEITDRKKPRMHVVLALIHDDGKYLLSKRLQKAHQGGKWELPGGKREKGETDREALAREVEEELGAEVLSARPFVKFHHEYEDCYLTFRVYRCRLFDATQVQALASDGIQWVSPEQFLGQAFPPANTPILERFREYHKMK